MRCLWISLGLVCLGIGAAGAVLPLIPTTPLLLLAAFCFARSSRRLHDWLITHPRLGPPIDDWKRDRAIRRPAKWLATVSVAAALGTSLLIGVGAMILALQTAALLVVLAFIWTRPEPGD
ncbi:MAG: YbaN family protein [Gammaproteobacteria bacterium]|nr:YbaN family protein [Gammaproteobacteria bacterium]